MAKNTESNTKKSYKGMAMEGLSDIEWVVQNHSLHKKNNLKYTIFFVGEGQGYDISFFIRTVEQFDKICR